MVESGESARERARRVLGSAGYEWGAFEEVTIDALAAAIEAAEARGREEERADVVAFAREHDNYKWFAEAIEGSAHLGGRDGE